MKRISKLAALLLALAMTFSLAGCGGSTNSTSGAAEPAQQGSDGGKTDIVIYSPNEDYLIEFYLSKLTEQFPDYNPIDVSFTLGNAAKALRMNGGTYLVNSLLISAGVGILGVLIATVTAYCSTRLLSPAARLLHLLSITSMAIPGLVLGLSYVLFFKTSFLYGTMAILVLVNMIHFFASSYLMLYNTFGKFNEHLEAVGLTLGASRLRIVWDVILPQCRGTMLEAFSYFFVNTMITISAVSFLANADTKPVALLIPQYESQSFLECSAFISLLILCCNLLVKAAVHLLKSAIARQDG